MMDKKPYHYVNLRAVCRVLDVGVFTWEINDIQVYEKMHTAREFQLKLGDIIKNVIKSNDEYKQDLELTDFALKQTLKENEMLKARIEKLNRALEKIKNMAVI